MRRSYWFALVLGLIAVAVLIFAWRNAPSSSGNGRTVEGQTGVWTCSMHPQIRSPRPGKCPICSMPLVRALSVSTSNSGANSAGEPMLTLSEHARSMASVATARVERRKLSTEIHAVGKVQYNESALATITSRVDGYIERLFIDYTGVEVKAGDHLVEIYSPELVSAQGELLIAQGGIAPLIRTKLRRWEISDEQIDEVVRTRKPLERITLSSPIDGTVTEKMVVKKSAVKAGDVLYRLANLDSVWVYLDIYEYELSLVRYGQSVDIATEAYPGELFAGRVWFINPVLTDESRTVKVLVNIANKEKRLKPGMFVSATIRAGLLADGKLAPTGVEGKWTCAMHPQVLEARSGPCPVCQMPLTQIPPMAALENADDELELAIPVTAVLDSGMRKLAFVERAPGEYSPSELSLGPRAGAFYPVLSGLKEGDLVAVRGGFLIDSQFQISGKPSLLYEHGQAGAVTHQHGSGQPATGAGSPASHGGHETPEAAEHQH